MIKFYTVVASINKYKWFNNTNAIIWNGLGFNDNQAIERASEQFSKLGFNDVVIQMYTGVNPIYLLPFFNKFKDYSVK